MVKELDTTSACGGKNKDSCGAQAVFTDVPNTVTLSDGQGVSIPAGALASDTVITVQANENPPQPTLSEMKIASEVLVFGPSG